MTIIDLTSERDRRNGPDPEFVRLDDAGRKMFAFSIEYKFEGEDWGANIWAYSMEDAQARLDSINASGSLMGQIYSEVPA